MYRSWSECIGADRSGIGADRRVSELVGVVGVVGVIGADRRVSELVGEYRRVSESIGVIGEYRS